MIDQEHYRNYTAKAEFSTVPNMAEYRFRRDEAMSNAYRVGFFSGIGDDEPDDMFPPGVNIQKQLRVPASC